MKDVFDLGRFGLRTYLENTSNRSDLMYGVVGGTRVESQVIERLDVNIGSKNLEGCEDECPAVLTLVYRAGSKQSWGSGPLERTASYSRFVHVS
jgi:hypothetical protein